MCVKELLRDIEECRSRMIQLTASASFTDHSVVDTSTKLDQLLNKYYTLTAKK
ncbi:MULTISPECIES: aspartyl-phosphate phosphatase Spo0E family protein [Cytobacillus]|uniref:Aspartyl-phosphate phosphatase Spo0E family protein n=1 Tax=Cytobacillus pseudoceanisediminis TaxID=3051614 RepID=A0ABZ2ZIS4_9BACI|nr:MULTISPECIES: aspartyl-phosphate phosphatase Spo0E family protein [Cytobacillus]MBU8732564.1 aspartyl-phosphate phosphatase Spo0E family protein [Cytobacillus oceanisediminis]MBU8772829.1 aspartyl-phosphate phosphatase Spo0E family protein [Cytobacillus oceanisediminis]MBY0157859.1 aspartyl-phosphate phosphatase Spo0E family protein [Cytobacillus firmus]MCS0674467.1 aspartyl-phosphate phosphatase Spo0E family protein [Cytobacillus firmus]MCS0826941.1 aspartyl-phosphate phosphatase Spo0E fam